jgi:ribokinase
MLSRKPIVVVGSINLDLVAMAENIPAIGETVIGTDFQMNPGGKGANQAVAIAQLGYPVSMIGRLGEDAFGAELRDHLQEAGVDISGVGTYEGPSGTALIVVSANGANSIVVVSGANSKVTPEYVEDNIGLIQEAGMVLTQLEIPIETIEYLATLCAREEIPLVLDPAPATSLSSNVLVGTAWFTPNETEASFYAGNGGRGPTGASDTARRLLKMGCRGVALKMGSKGVYLASQSGQAEFVQAFSVKAVDTTAAGDAFNGAFAVGLMMGRSPRESALFASAVAAISVTRMGAQRSMPTLAEAEAFMTEHSDEMPKRVSQS